DGSTSDGMGTVLLGVQGQFDNGEDNWLGFDASGHQVGFAFSSPMGQLPLFPQESGFQWFNAGTVCSVGTGGCTTSAVLRQLSSNLSEISRITLFEYRAQDNNPPPSEILWSASKDTGRGLAVPHLPVSSPASTL